MNECHYCKCKSVMNKWMDECHYCKCKSVLNVFNMDIRKLIKYKLLDIMTASTNIVIIMENSFYFF